MRKELINLSSKAEFQKVIDKKKITILEIGSGGGHF